MSAQSEPVFHNPYLHDIVWRILEKTRRTSSGSVRLLDIPSGPGYFSRRATAAGIASVSAEIDPKLHVFKDLNYVRCDMSQKLPFEDESFDYVVSIEGIEHIENQFLFLRECARVLKPGGGLLMTTPNASSLENRLIFLITGSHEKPYGPVRSDTSCVEMEHINLIPFSRLELFLRFAGLSITSVNTYRYKKGSLFLWPFVWPLLRLMMFFVYIRKYASRNGSDLYRHIMGLYASKEVLCGSHLILHVLKK